MKQKLAIFLISLSLFAVPVLASARGLVPCGGYEANGSREKPCQLQDIFIMVARATNFLIAVSGLLAVYYIISAGFWLIISMGNEESITKHKNAINNAVVGLGMVFVAFMF